MPISDVVFLDGNDPEEMMFSDDPYSYGKWFSAKNIDTIPLSVLGELLGVASYKELMKGFQPILPPEGESFLLSFPEPLQDRIRVLSDQEIVDVASKWSKIDEFRGGVVEESLQNYIKGLRSFLNSVNGYASLFLSV